jgi:hypothetical protein
VGHYIYEFSFPTKEKDILPQEKIDIITDLRMNLKTVFYKINEL